MSSLIWLDQHDLNNANGAGLNYNSAATATDFFSKFYGNSIRLIKDDSTDPGTLTDKDGNIYKTVKIGNQVWTASNWKCTHYSDGSEIPNVTDNTAWSALTTGAWCVYNNDINNK